MKIRKSRVMTVLGLLLPALLCGCDKENGINAVVVPETTESGYFIITFNSEDVPGDLTVSAEGVQIFDIYTGCLEDGEGVAAGRYKGKRDFVLEVMVDGVTVLLQPKTTEEISAGEARALVDELRMDEHLFLVAEGLMTREEFELTTYGE